MRLPDSIDLEIKSSRVCKSYLASKPSNDSEQTTRFFIKSAINKKIQL